MTPEQILILAEARKRKQAQPSAVDNFNTQARSYIEPLLSMGSSMIAEPIAGAAGLVTSLIPGTAEGSGAGVVRGVKDRLTYQPRLPESRANMQAVGETIAPVVEPVTDAFDAVANLAYEVSGSPAIGAAVRTAPTAVAEALGLGAIRGIRSGVRLLDVNGNPTRMLERALDKNGLVFENLTPEARALIPEFAGKDMIPVPKSEIASQARDIVKTQIKTGGKDGALAPLMLQGDEIVTDVQALGAIKQGWKEGTVQMVKASNADTKKQMDRMLNMRWRLLKNETLSAEMRPTDIVGDAFRQRLDFVIDKANTARDELNDIAKNKLRGVFIDARPVVDDLYKSLDRMDVKYVEDARGVPTLDYQGSVIQANKGAQKVINDAVRLMATGGRPDAYRFHILKRQLDDLIDFKKKSKGGLSENGRNVLKSLRHTLNQQLRQSIPRYAEVNDVLSRSLQSLDDFQRTTKVDINLLEDPTSAIGQAMRKLHTNYQVRSDLKQSLDNIDQFAKELGGEFNSNYGDLSMFANKLDERFGSSASGSFQGLNEAALRSAAFNGPTQAGKEAIFNKGIEAMRGLQGISDYNAYQTMKSLLSRK